MTISRLHRGSKRESSERFRYVELVARCGELGGEPQGSDSRGLMWAREVVVGDPAGDGLEGVIRAGILRL